MFDKNKNITNNLERYICLVVSHLGLAVMSLTAIVSMLELHESRATKFLPSILPTFATSMQGASMHAAEHNKVEERVRREKEENRHALVSYGTTMRSHPTSGPA